MRGRSPTKLVATLGKTLRARRSPSPQSPFVDKSTTRGYPFEPVGFAVSTWDVFPTRRLLTASDVVPEADADCGTPEVNASLLLALAAGAICEMRCIET